MQLRLLIDIAARFRAAGLHQEHIAPPGRPQFQQPKQLAAVAVCGQRLGKGQPLHAVLSNWPRLGTADDAQADMLLVTPQQLFLIAGGSVVEIKHRNFHAIGSGGEYALGAMSAGCDARKALEVAALIDAFTGGDIETAPEFTSEEIAKCVLVTSP